MSAAVQTPQLRKPSREEDSVSVLPVFLKLYFVCPLFFQKLVWIPTRLILRFFGHLEVRGLNNLKDIRTNVIFAANHSSEIDAILIPASLPFWSRFSPMFFAVREKAYYDTCGWRKHFFGGPLIKMWGGYPVLVGLRDYGRSLPNHTRIVRSGGNLCVFPEGGTTPDGNIQPAKGGLTYLAEHTKCPIVPVSITGVYKMTVADFVFRRRRIVVCFGQTIDQRELKARSNAGNGNVYKAEGAYVMRKIAAMCETLP